MKRLRPLIAMAAILVLVGCAPLLSGLLPQGRTRPYRAPDAEHLLGTDALGNDVLGQLLAHAPATFGVPAVAALVLAVLGSASGCCSVWPRPAYGRPSRGPGT
ncbi:hypothetical protein [Parenemella sanctibonifatiensis]|uniref:hypothetical protein n=1 Tax=Parenemella sanctibonifatiensis TaxID=2016505 RepID=UPI0015C59B72|nr:hypothetical protein [Parenemella sanctibonifatiensis]